MISRVKYHINTLRSVLVPDPEEFLTSLVAQILKADPYLKLSSGQEAYHYQLFVEKNEKLVLPTVQQLFEQSFFASDIKLKEVSLPYLRNNEV